MPETKPKPSTVADELYRRDNCRYGLNGIRMRHVPTGREFVCGGTFWEAGRVRIINRPPRPTPAPPPIPGKKRTLYTVCLADIVEMPLGPGDVYEVEDCLLLERWPVVCCRPKRRKRRTP